MTTTTNESQYIGTGEQSTQKILQQLFPHCRVLSQFPLAKLIPESIKELGSEYSKHLCDLFVLGKDMALVIEVNLKHGTLAHKKWKVYKEHLEAQCYDTMTIDDNECTHLFESDPDNLTWADYEDVIASLELAGIKPR